MFARRYAYAKAFAHTDYEYNKKLYPKRTCQYPLIVSTCEYCCRAKIQVLPASTRNFPSFPSSAQNLALPSYIMTRGALNSYSADSGALVPYSVLSRRSMLLPDYQSSDLPTLPLGRSISTDIETAKPLLSPESLLLPAKYTAGIQPFETTETYSDQLKWVQSLKKEEIRAIRIYTGDGYMGINKFLRDHIAKLPDDLPTNIIDTINNAINKMVIPEPITVYRGTDTFEDINKHFTYYTNKQLLIVAAKIDENFINVYAKMLSCYIAI